jgi:hypothetical protein
MSHAHVMIQDKSNLSESEKLWRCYCGKERPYPLPEPSNWRNWRHKSQKESRAIAKSMADQGSELRVAEGTIYEPGRYKNKVS